MRWAAACAACCWRDVGMPKDCHCCQAPSMHCARPAFGCAFRPISACWPRPWACTAAGRKRWPSWARRWTAPPTANHGACRSCCGSTAICSPRSTRRRPGSFTAALPRWRANRARCPGRCASRAARPYYCAARDGRPRGRESSQRWSGNSPKVSRPPTCAARGRSLENEIDTSRVADSLISETSRVAVCWRTNLRKPDES